MTGFSSPPIEKKRKREGVGFCAHFSEKTEAKAKKKRGRTAPSTDEA